MTDMQWSCEKCGLLFDCRDDSNRQKYSEHIQNCSNKIKCEPNLHHWKLMYAEGTNKVSHLQCALCHEIDSKCLKCLFDKTASFTVVDDSFKGYALCDDCKKWVGDNLIEPALIPSPLGPEGKSEPSGKVFRWNDTQHLTCESCKLESSFRCYGYWIQGEGFKCDKCGANQELKVKDIFPEEKVNHPKHYNSHPSGVECIDIIRHMPHNVGAAIKYCWRAGLKDGSPTVEDYKKAIWYLEDEIKRITK
jgi:hypothetical protein